MTSGGNAAEAIERTRRTNFGQDSRQAQSEPKVDSGRLHLELAPTSLAQDVNQPRSMRGVRGLGIAMHLGIFKQRPKYERSCRRLFKLVMAAPSNKIAARSSAKATMTAPSLVETDSI